MTQDDAHRLELQLSSLQRSMEIGFATVDGKISLMMRGEEYNVREVQEQEQRLKALEERRFPFPIIGGLMGMASVCISLFALTRGG